MRLYTTRLIATLAFTVLMAPLAANAQPPGKTASIGYLTNVVGRNLVEETFERALQELGWSRERNLRIASRYSGGQQDTIAALAAELVGLGVDVIVAWGPELGLAAKRATRQIPVVFCSMFADPVDFGIVSNVARPGGNITGVTMHGHELDAKRLELLKEAVPSLRRITLLVSAEETLFFTSERRRLLTAAAQALHLEVDETHVATSSEVEAAIREAKTRGAQALYVPPSGFAFSFLQDIAAVALAHQLPSIYAYRESVRAGGLLSYAPSVLDIARRGAVYVDKILRGAKPGDLPIEQPTKFELVINLKTAQALGITMPPTLLFQADEVIR
jgi:putative tryptophan/tyrosine transport system substrate-binding protein